MAEAERSERARIYYTEPGPYGLHRVHRPDGTPLPSRYRPPVVHPYLVLNGPTLLQWRESLGLTQRQLAILASVSRGVISGIETGYRNGTQEMSQALANALVEEARRQQEQRG